MSRSLKKTIRDSKTHYEKPLTISRKKIINCNFLYGRESISFVKPVLLQTFVEVLAILLGTNYDAFFGDFVAKIKAFDTSANPDPTTSSPFIT